MPDNKKLDPAALHIVLVEPEIPPNTGNIARLCACTACHLHLIHPLGFEINDRTLRRAGLDYWPHVHIREYCDWQDFRHQVPDQATLFAFSTHAQTSLWDCRFRPGDVLVFGPETRGLNKEILQQSQGVRIPMRHDAPVRSLNLSNACSIAVYEALRQWED